MVKTFSESYSNVAPPKAEEEVRLVGLKSVFAAGSLPPLCKSPCIHIAFPDAGRFFVAYARPAGYPYVCGGTRQDRFFPEGEKMMRTVWAVIHGGRIEPSEPVELLEGSRVLVTLLPEDADLPEEERRFWLQASEASLSAIWDNSEDDGYAELLEE
jgi:hypothetical protein